MWARIILAGLILVALFNISALASPPGRAAAITVTSVQSVAIPLGGSEPFDPMLQAPQYPGPQDIAPLLQRMAAASRAERSVLCYYLYDAFRRHVEIPPSARPGAVAILARYLSDGQPKVVSVAARATEAVAPTLNDPHALEVFLRTIVQKLRRPGRATAGTVEAWCLALDAAGRQALRRNTVHTEDELHQVLVSRSLPLKYTAALLLATGTGLLPSRRLIGFLRAAVLDRRAPGVIRMRCAVALNGGPNSKKRVDVPLGVLAQLTRDPDPSVRYWAVDAIANGIAWNSAHASSDQRRMAESSLSERLFDRKLDIADKAWTGLTWLGWSEIASPLRDRFLLYGLSDPRPIIRRVTLGRFWNFLSPVSPELASRVCALLDDPDPSVRETAFQIVRRLGSTGGAALPRLRQALSSPYVLIRARAALALHVLDPAASPKLLLPDVEILLRRGDYNDRMEAALALEELGSGSELTVRALVEAFREEPDFYLRADVAEALVKLAPDRARPLVTSYLRAIVKHPEIEYQTDRAKKLLKALGEKP